jgi:hypothetical protein
MKHTLVRYKIKPEEAQEIVRWAREPSCRTRRRPLGQLVRTPKKWIYPGRAFVHSYEEKDASIILTSRRW